MKRCTDIKNERFVLRIQLPRQDILYSVLLTLQILFKTEKTMIQIQCP
jgi:hypothetical protein